jgi:hypothetical protein
MAGVVSLVTLLALTACGEPNEPADPDAGGPGGQQDQVYAANGMVLDTGKQAVLCLGGVNDSLPPQCSGIPITNWSWEDVDDEESASGTSWGSYRVTGTYDGDSFTLTKTPGPPKYDEGDDFDISVPCDEPPGGWVASDPAKVSEEAQSEAIASARSEPDFAGAWIDYIEEPQGESGATADNVIITLAFTGDLDRHESEIQETWGGPLCVWQLDYTLDDLLDIQSELGSKETAQELGYEMLWSSTSENGNYVEIGVLLATDELRQAIAERYGEGTVVVHSALVPVE